jgi:26S proteasome non-ATPase regulatory subunit 9
MDIHAPTVASGPASGGPARDISKLAMPDLMQEKERIEEEMSALSSVLQSVRYLGSKLLQFCLTIPFKHGVPMTASLTTFDGYPRDDIDIAQGMPRSPIGGTIAKRI